MSGGVVRVASKQVSVVKEIAIGMGLGLVAGVGWRAWHVSYKAKIDDYYVKLNAQSK